MKLQIIVLAITLSFMNVTAGSAGKYVAPHHHHFHKWYQEIQKLLGISGCCDEENNDCGPVENYEDMAVGARVFLEDGKWHYTGAEVKKYYVNTPDGKAHACRQPITDGFGNRTGMTFYCLFLPQPMT